jgi:hypothetical protein
MNNLAMQNRKKREGTRRNAYWTHRWTSTLDANRRDTNANLRVPSHLQIECRKSSAWSSQTHDVTAAALQAFAGTTLSTRLP